MRFQVVCFTLPVPDLGYRLLDGQQSFNSSCVRLSLIFCWLAGGYTQPWLVAEDVSPDAGRTGPEGLAIAEDAFHLWIPPFSLFDLFGHDNKVPFLTSGARHGARLFCADLQGFQSYF
jgi:hypothetical protein